MASFKYSTLSLKSYEIRLLTLHPGNFSSDIIISLENIDLQTNPAPHYEALSYTWGSLDNPVHITVHSENNGTLRIMQNLATALPYIRFPDRPRVLWIDGICIDQQNLSERSDQVGKMADIYQIADRVIVWLGVDENLSYLALSTLNALGSKVDVDWSVRTMKPASTGHPEAHWASLNDKLPYDWITWNAIYYFLHRPWFERLWIWQEIGLQRREAVMLCGKEIMLWQCFRRSIYCLRAKLMEPNIRGLNDRLDYIFSLCDVGTLRSLESLTNLTKYANCSDPRDRIYAISGMIDKSEIDIQIVPNYTKSVSQVYKEVAIEYFKKRRNLEILRTSGIRQKISKLPKWIPGWVASTCVEDHAMPSWVPNWSTPSTALDLPYCYASGGGFYEAKCTDGKVLEVTGFAFCNICFVENILPPDAAHNMPELLQVIQTLVMSYPENVSYVAGGSLLDAFLRTFCCNAFDEVYLPPNSLLPNFTNAKQIYLSLPKCQSKDVTPIPLELNNYLRYAHEYVLGRILFRTEEGYIGLGPETCQVGNIVCVVLGRDAPVMLRPVGNNEWVMVGSCYVYGTESSRILLGDLPESYKRVLRFDVKSKHWWPAYLNQQTGETQIEDPRLGPLPTGWRVKHHEHESAWNFYTTDEYEAVNSPQTKPAGDPRLTPDAIRERGVRLVDFLLV